MFAPRRTPKHDFGCYFSTSRFWMLKGRFLSLVDEFLRGLFGGFRGFGGFHSGGHTFEWFVDTNLPSGYMC